MSGKRGPLEGMYGGAPQDPRDMARAELLEPQSQRCKCPPVATMSVGDAIGYGLCCMKRSRTS